MRVITLLACLLFVAPAYADHPKAEPVAPPKAAACPACAKPAAAAPVVIIVRPMTLLERMRDRRMARLADQYTRAAERASRGVLFLRVGVAMGGCRRMDGECKNCGGFHFGPTYVCPFPQSTVEADVKKPTIEEFDTILNDPNPPNVNVLSDGTCKPIDPLTATLKLLEHCSDAECEEIVRACFVKLGKAAYGKLTAHDTREADSVPLKQTIAARTAATDAQ